MTSISSNVPRPDPRAQLDARISAATSAGTIRGTDQDALSSALDTIDSSLAASPTGDVKDRIDGLIDAQVKSGALSDDQAGELRSFFAQAPDGEKRGGAHHAHGPHGVGGRPPSSDEDATEGEAATQISAAASRQLDAMSAFLQKLRDTAASGTATYGGNAGTTGNGGSATGLVINTNA